MKESVLCDADLATVTAERDDALRRLEGLASARLCAEFARVDTELRVARAERDQALASLAAYDEKLALLTDKARITELEEERAELRGLLEGVGRQVGWPTKEEEQAGQTIVDRVANAVDDARGQRDLLYGQFTCYSPGCGVRRTHKTDKEKCPCAHEESWGHEWVTQRSLDLAQLCYERSLALTRVTEERDSTARELQRVDEARLLALKERDEAAQQAFEAMAKSLDTQS